MRWVPQMTLRGLVEIGIGLLGWMFLMMATQFFFLAHETRNMLRLHETSLQQRTAAAKVVNGISGLHAVIAESAVAEKPQLQSSKQQLVQLYISRAREGAAELKRANAPHADRAVATVEELASAYRGFGSAQMDAARASQTQAAADRVASEIASYFLLPKQDAQAGFSKGVAQSVIEQMGGPLKWITAFFMAGALGLAILILSTVLRGLRRLTAGAVAFAGKDLDYRIPVKGPIEFRAVAEQFNGMALDLKAAQEQLELSNAEIRKQQDLAESLLLNVLPPDVAAELKTKGAVDARYHDNVTILFTDFQGFTLSTEKLPAEELVKALHAYFTAFDGVIQRYGLEKLKTIGDSYMCVAGLTALRPSHAVDAVLAAFSMIEEVVRGHAQGLPPWAIRIGVHTGPVISGVVGIRKFAFDIWGESVNFASRVEATGHPNRINVSSATYKLVKDFFACEYRGKVTTKESREFDMYFAVGVAESLKQAGPDAFAARYRTYFHRELPALPGSLAPTSAASA